MKIGILTYWNSCDNYGQILQCFALQRYLNNQGHTAFLIKYAPTKDMGVQQKIWRNLSIQRILYFFSKERKLNKEKSRIEKRFQIINGELNKQRQFENFRNTYLIATKHIYHSIDELRKNPPVANVYISGSDQVWNDSLKEKNTAGCFLDFGDCQVKRISYAASIGRELQQKELVIFSKYLSRFDAISVREQSTKEICDKLGFADSTVTLDPTLLLPVDEYSKISQSAHIHTIPPYLFLYVLNVTTQEEIYWENIKEYLQEKELNMKVVCSSGYVQARELIPGYNNIQATIPEWLSYIENAACIITSSFHGMVFAIKMNIPFLVILLTNQYAKGNIRITLLLKKLGLEERILDPLKPIKEQMEKEINWTKVNKELSKLQESSYNFLHSNL